LNSIAVLLQLLYVFNKDLFVSFVVMFKKDSGNRSTACGLEAGTLETAATTTTIWTFSGEKVQLPTVPSTVVASKGVSE